MVNAEQVQRKTEEELRNLYRDYRTWLDYYQRVREGIEVTVPHTYDLESMYKEALQCVQLELNARKLVDNILALCPQIPTKRRTKWKMKQNEGMLGSATLKKAWSLLYNGWLVGRSSGSGNTQ